MTSEKLNYSTDTIALRKKALECGINTCAELARRSGVNRNTIGKVLNGEEQPSANVMYKLIDCLKLSPAQAGVIFFNASLRNA